MNKSELVTLLRDPGHLTAQQLNELESIVADHPYFLSARLLLAKGSKELKHSHTKKRIASAAIYSTDRVLFKKYLSGDLFFLSQPKIEAKPERKKVVTASEKAVVEVKSEAKREDKRPSALKETTKKPVPEVPNVPAGDLDAILEELKQDMQNLKSSRAHFVEVQQQIEEEDELASIKKSVEEAVEQDSKKEIDGLVENTAANDQKEEPIEEEIITEKPKSSKKTSDKPKTPRKKTTSKTKTTEVMSSDEEDEIVNKKLAELAKNQSASKKKEEPVIESEVQKEEPKKSEQTKEEKLKKSSRRKEKEEKEPLDSQPAEKQTEEKPEKLEEPDNYQEERAEDPFKESRFDREATRSYLRKLEPPEEFPFFDDDEPDSSSKSSENEEISVQEDEAKPQMPKKKTAAKKESSDDQKETAKEPVKAKAKPKSTTTPKKTTEKPATSIKEDQPKKEPVAKDAGEAVVKEEVKDKEATKPREEVKPKEPKSTASKSTESAMPKGSIMKKAKLVKSKRSSRKSGSPSINKSEKGNDDDGKSDRERQKSIIDRFIKDSPSIKYTKETEESAGDLAETSGTWDKNLASEYLAEIYLNQGNKKRAIEIYEALILKYPEKKSYFADLISKSK